MNNQEILDKWIEKSNGMNVDAPIITTKKGSKICMSAFKIVGDLDEFLNKFTHNGKLKLLALDGIIISDTKEFGHREFMKIAATTDEL